MRKDSSILGDTSGRKLPQALSIVRDLPLARETLCTPELVSPPVASSDIGAWRVPKEPHSGSAGGPPTIPLPREEKAHRFLPEWRSSDIVFPRHLPLSAAKASPGLFSLPVGPSFASVDLGEERTGHRMMSSVTLSSHSTPPPCGVVHCVLTGELSAEAGSETCDSTIFHSSSSFDTSSVRQLPQPQVSAMRSLSAGAAALRIRKKGRRVLFRTPPSPVAQSRARSFSAKLKRAFSSPSPPSAALSMTNRINTATEASVVLRDVMPSEVVQQPWWSFAAKDLTQVSTYESSSTMRSKAVDPMPHSLDSSLLTFVDHGSEGRTSVASTVIASHGIDAASVPFHRRSGEDVTLDEILDRTPSSTSLVSQCGGHSPVRVALSRATQRSVEYAAAVKVAAKYGSTLRQVLALSCSQEAPPVSSDADSEEELRHDSSFMESEGAAS